MNNYPVWSGKEIVKKGNLYRNYIKSNPWIKYFRTKIGEEQFDEKYRALYKFLSTLHYEQYFFIENLCKKDPSNHDLVLGMCDIYHNMDYYVSMKYDSSTDKITIKVPEPKVYFLRSYPNHYWPKDFYSLVVKYPESFGLNKNDLTEQ